MGELLIGGKLFVCELAFGDNTERRCAWCGNPLVGRRTRWCCDLCPDVFGREHYWTNAREWALKKSRGICARCGDVPNRPEVNHRTPILGLHAVGGCHHHSVGLEVLCHPCHLIVTAEQRAAGLLTRG